MRMILIYKNITINALKVSAIVGTLLCVYVYITHGLHIASDGVLIIGLFLIPFAISVLAEINKLKFNPLPFFCSTPFFTVSLLSHKIIYTNAAFNKILSELNIPLDSPDKHFLTASLLAQLKKYQKSDEPLIIQETFDDRIFEYKIYCIDSLYKAHIHLEDISDKIDNINMLKWQASHDDLTRLPNRYRLMQDMQQLIDEGQLFTLGLVMITNFNVITMRNGIQNSDSILIELGNRIQKFANHSFDNKLLCYCINGPIFPILIANSDEKFDRVVERFFSNLISLPFNQTERYYQLHCKTGMIFHKPGLTPEQMLNGANIALHAALQNNNSEPAWYTSKLGQEIQAALEIEENLKYAIPHQQLFMVYQPKIRLSDNQYMGAESLMRWNFNHETISPTLFIPLAENTGHIIELGAWALETSCRQWVTWFKQGRIDESFIMAVNVSPIQINHPEFIERVNSILEMTEMHPHSLELEITETTLVHDFNRCINIMKILRKKGIHFSIDDFGTGYSSLSYLVEMPITQLKIDRSFVMHSQKTPTNKTLLKSIIDLAHALKIKVLAEGIETETHLELLSGFRCDFGQGYLYSKPLKNNDFISVYDQSKLFGGLMTDSNNLNVPKIQ